MFKSDKSGYLNGKLTYWSLDTGAQPLVNDDNTLALAVNGEIYNHRILRKELNVPYEFKTHSDCEVIIPLVCAGNFLYARCRYKECRKADTV